MFWNPFFHPKYIHITFYQHMFKPNPNQKIAAIDIKLRIRIIRIKRRKYIEPDESEGTLSLYIQINGVQLMEFQIARYTKTQNHERITKSRSKV